MSATITHPERLKFMKQAIRLAPERSLDHTQDRMEDLTELASVSVSNLRREGDAWRTFADFLIYLNRGHLRAAEPTFNNTWHVNDWVKAGIMVGFKLGGVVPMSQPHEGLVFTDRPAFPLRPVLPGENIRIVPGGSSVRAGTFLGEGTTVMPPSYINTGVYIGRETLVDSKVLVGSCAQIGENCHLSMDASIGGVIEPPQAMPCIVGNRVTMFAGSKIAEGVVLEDGVVLAMNASLASSIELHDLVEGRQIYPINGRLIVPSDAVVVAASAPFRDNQYAKKLGILKPIAVIVKYRDRKTDAKTVQDQALRMI